MAEPFLGQISMFGGTFAPRGWALCNGQLLMISQYSALFSLLGTIYGGDGRTTFGLPDLRGRAPIHFGTGPGLSPRKQGARGGSETNTMTVAQLPSHGHVVRASTAAAGVTTPTGNVLADSESYVNADPNTDMRAGTTTNTGGGQPINNMPPFLVINYIIALSGTFPSRN